MDKIALAIHGGAGTILRSELTPELEHEYRDALERSLRAGWKILRSGGTALDAVEAAVVCLEDDPLFNAGRGSVFTSDEKNEMDAAIMDGRDLAAGAVAFVRNIKNPVKLARLVMERTEHVLLAGNGADEFAKEIGAEFETDEYFFTDCRFDQLLNARAAGRTQLDHAAGEDKETGRQGDREKARQGGQSQIAIRNSQMPNPQRATSNHQTNPKSEIRNPKSLGTVGAVACDIRGNLAAATSTGGMTNKKFGRVGDSAIVGAGTYADNAACAVSCTGHGEYFMKAVTAYDVSARMKYQGLSLAEAAREAIGFLTKIGGEGGLIAVDALGNLALPFNSEGMYRGWIEDGAEPMVEIYR